MHNIILKFVKNLDTIIIFINFICVNFVVNYFTKNTIHLFSPSVFDIIPQNKKFCNKKDSFFCLF